MARIQHGTLVADNITEVEVDEWHSVEIMNVDGAAAIYFRVDGEDPEVEGDDCEVLPAAMSALEVDIRHDQPVRLISSGTPKWSVKAT